MKRPVTPRPARAEELLADRATYGTDESIEAELRSLAAHDDTTFDEAAAAVEMATLRLEPMPGHVADRILAQTPRDVSASIRAIPVSSEKKPDFAPAALPSSRSTTFAWLAAAACFALAATSLIWSLTRRPEVRVVTLPSPSASSSAPETRPAPTPAEERAAVASAKDAVRVEWTATKDPASQGASGDVVWSASLQKGYMRFVGLAPNDKTVGQYQLWIFDKDRDARYPVDGGVFDIGSNGEVLVPISSKLRVDAATLFAVTFEKPGGVVVSKRDRMIVTAAVKSG